MGRGALGLLLAALMALVGAGTAAAATLHGTVSGAPVGFGTAPVADVAVTASDSLTAMPVAVGVTAADGSYDLTLGDGSYDLTLGDGTYDLRFAPPHDGRFKTTDVPGTAISGDGALDLTLTANNAPGAGLAATGFASAQRPYVWDASPSFDTDGAIVHYEWDLDGDGVFETDTGTVPTVAVTYPEASRRVVARVRVTDDDGATATASSSTQVHGVFIARLTGPATAPRGVPVTFDASSSTIPMPGHAVTWDFHGDGESVPVSNAVTVRHIFQRLGTGTVTVHIMTLDGLTATASTTIQITADPPVARLSAPATVASGAPFTLDASASSALGGGISRYEWDLDGDGEYELDGAASPTVSTVLAGGGDHVVGVRVTDDVGDTAIASATINVPNVPPVARIAALGPAHRGEPLTLDARASSDDGTIVRYEWDLDGNGGYETDGGAAPTLVHAFSTLGDHQVGLRVTDDAGATDVTAVTFAVVNRPPTVAFTFAPAAPRTVDTVAFRSTSADADGTIARHEWDLDGNGTYETQTGTTPVTSRRYTRPGTYVVSLRVTDSDGATALVAHPVGVACTLQLPIFGICLM